MSPRDYFPYFTVLTLCFVLLVRTKCMATVGMHANGHAWTWKSGIRARLHVQNGYCAGLMLWCMGTMR